MPKRRENERAIDTLVRDYFASDIERVVTPAPPDRRRLSGAKRGKPREPRLAGLAAAAAITLVAGIAAYADNSGMNAPELARLLERLAVSHNVSDRLSSIVIETGRAFRLGTNTTTSARRPDASRQGGEP